MTSASRTRAALTQETCKPLCSIVLLLFSFLPSLPETYLFDALACVLLARNIGQESFDVFVFLQSVIRVQRRTITAAVHDSLYEKKASRGAA